MQFGEQTLMEHGVHNGRYLANTTELSVFGSDAGRRYQYVATCFVIAVTLYFSCVFFCRCSVHYLASPSITDVRRVLYYHRPPDNTSPPSTYNHITL